MVSEDIVNPFGMKKADLLKLFKGRCKHGHTYAEHPACYTKEKGAEVKIGYIDIESSQLKGNFGIMLSYAIKEKGADNILCNTISKKDIEDETLDKNLVKQCIEDMRKFDLLMGYYSTKFDIPFIRTRAMYWNLDFPLYGELQHKDIWYMVRSKMSLHSNKLEVACRHIGIEGKTHLDGSQWNLAIAGNKKALKYVMDHNKADVIILEKLHERIKSFVKDSTRPL